MTSPTIDKNIYYLKRDLYYTGVDMAATCSTRHTKYYIILTNCCNTASHKSGGVWRTVVFVGRRRGRTHRPDVSFFPPRSYYGPGRWRRRQHRVDNNNYYVVSLRVLHNTVATHVCVLVCVSAREFDGGRASQRTRVRKTLNCQAQRRRILHTHVTSDVYFTYILLYCVCMGYYNVRSIYVYIYI